ncbi:MAG: hypothetical protein ACK559_28545, partial [bacterium]
MLRRSSSAGRGSRGHHGRLAGLVRFVGVPAQHRQHHHEPHDIGHRHMPAVTHPVRDRARLGESGGERHAGRGTEPEHGAPESDRERKEAPVVAALLERETGQRDVVEHRGDEPQAQCRHPPRRRQVLDRHHRGAQHQREQEHGAAGCGRHLVPVGTPEQGDQGDGHPDRHADEREAARQFGVVDVHEHVDADRGHQDERDDAQAGPLDPLARIGIGLDGLQPVLLH